MHVWVFLSITIIFLEKVNEQCGCRIIAIEKKNQFPFPIGQRDFYFLTSADPDFNGKWFTYIVGYFVVLTEMKKENKSCIKHFGDYWW